MGSVENDLRHKLLHAEMQNMVDSMNRMESLSGIDGWFSDFKDAAVKKFKEYSDYFSGKKKLADVYKFLHEKLKDATMLIPNTETLVITRNGIEVVIHENSSGLKITAHGQDYDMPKTNDELLNDIKTWTKEKATTAASMGDFFRYSKAILECKSGPHVRAF